jgi:hypothetical protein
MMKWSTNRVNPAVAARTAMPRTSRQPTATAPLASRGAAAEMHRGAALAQRGAAKDEDKNKESLFNRDEDKDKDKDKDEDGLDEAAIAPDDHETDDEPDEDKDVIIVVA